MTKTSGMDPAIYKFIWVPLCAVIGLIIITGIIKDAIPNPFFRYLIMGGGLLGTFAFYYREQLKSFIK